MKLSIIVPVYNSQDDIFRCLKSLVDQTEKVKIIVINDGSTDNSENIILDFKNKYPELIDYYSIKNEGISNARNFGISKVNTEYFGFLDSDDYVDINMAKEMLEVIERDQSDICIADFTWVYSDHNKYQVDTNYEDIKDIITRMYATLWNKIYRTSFIRRYNISFPYGLRYEDASYLYRLAIHMDKVSYINKSYVSYVQKEGSITHTFSYFVKDMIEVFKGIVDYYKENGVYEKYFAELEYLHIRFFLGNSYLRACRINDKELRNKILEESWNYLNDNFKDFKKNKYLNNGGKKNLYFKYINKRLYYINVYLFRLLYKFKIMR